MKDIKSFLPFIFILTLILNSGCISNTEDDANHLYVIYSEPMDVNTTIYVDGELVLDLTNRSFLIYPPVSDIVNLEDQNEYQIMVVEENFNLSLNKNVVMNGNNYVSIFISKEKISITTLKDKPEFE